MEKINEAGAAPRPPLADSELAELERLLSEGTQGPWRFDEDCEIFPESGGELLIEKEVAAVVSDGCVTDAALICELRNAAPALLAEVRLLRARCAELLAAAIEARAGIEPIPAGFAALSRINPVIAKAEGRPSSLGSAPGDSK